MTQFHGFGLIRSPMAVHKFQLPGIVVGMECPHFQGQDFYLKNFYFRKCLIFPPYCITHFFYLTIFIYNKISGIELCLIHVEQTAAFLKCAIYRSPC